MKTNMTTQLKKSWMTCLKRRKREKRDKRGKRERDAFTLPDLPQVRGKGEVRKEEKGGAKAV